MIPRAQLIVQYFEFILDLGVVTARAWDVVFCSADEVSLYGVDEGVVHLHLWDSKAGAYSL